MGAPYVSYFIEETERNKNKISITHFQSESINISKPSNSKGGIEVKPLGTMRSAASAIATSSSEFMNFIAFFMVSKPREIRWSCFRSMFSKGPSSAANKDQNLLLSFLGLVCFP